MNSRKARKAANYYLKKFHGETGNVFGKKVFHKNDQFGGKLKFRNRSHIIQFLKSSLRFALEDLIPN